MEKNVPNANTDIATEPYKGPGAFVTGAGEGAIAHYGTMFAGLIGGGVLSGIFYEQVGKIEEAFSKFYQNNHQDPSFLKSTTAKIAGWVHRTSHNLAGHLPGKEKLLSRVPQERVSAVIFGGGILGFVGFFIAPAFFMISGAKHSNIGRKQFKRAQDEIITVREERDTLRDKYVETKMQLNDLLAKQPTADDLRISPDDQPVISSTTEPQTTALLDSPTGPSAPVIGPENVLRETPTTIEAPVIGPAPTTGRTLPPNSAPIIQQPVIGPEMTDQSWGERLAARDAEQAQHEHTRA